MFLILSKLLPLFVYPVGLAILLLTVGLVAHRHARVRWTCHVAALVVLLVFSNPWASDQLVQSLEWRYSPQEDYVEADAIVLLGGGTRPHLPPRPISEMNEAGDRMVYAAQLYHEDVAPVIVASGGFIEFYGTLVPETDAMTEILLALGVPQDAILPEDRSRNTYENAVYVRDLLDQFGANEIVLVTSAMHMPRSVAIFEHQGFVVRPAPVDYFITRGVPGMTTDSGWVGRALEMLPSAEHLDRSTRALREYIGIAVYRLRGWL